MGSNQKKTGKHRQSDREAWLEKLEFLSDTMESTAQPFAAGSPDGSLIAFNRAFCTLTGRAREDLENIDWINDLISGDSREADLELLKTLDYARTPQRYEKKYRRKDGTIKHIELLLNTARDSRGKTLFYYAIITDISERCKTVEDLRQSCRRLESVLKERADALSKSEEHFRSIIEASPVPMVVFDENRNYTINKEFTELFGYDIEDVPSVKEWWPLAYPDESYRKFVKERWYAAVSEAVKNRTSIEPQEAVVTCKDGSQKHILCYFASIGERNLAVFHDITGRKRMEEALRSSEVRFRALIQNSSDIIRIIGRDGRIVYDSPSSEKILGYPAGAMIGKSPLDFIHPEDREMVRRDLNEVLDRNNPGIPTEFRIRKADGSYLDVESTGVNLIGTPGVDGIVITTRPITERKRAAADLKKAKDQAELYLDLMGHDINNLHQIAMGYLEFAREIAGPESVEYEFIDKPLEVLRRGARLIDNVRKLQKLREDAYVKGTYNVREVLEGALGEFRDMPGITITADYHSNGDCRIIANDLLSDVFTNLVDNAIKHARYMPRIAISLEKVRENGRDHYQVAVEDNGPGIPDTMKGKIFNRLLEGDSHSRGMGLGLYMVKSLVEEYDGRVWVEDRVAGDHASGARFVVMLPAARQPGAL
ncbi:MAG: sensory histidine kinase AtoS [Methanocella sp. PtaU1.Bin125]|nr:MAG: sensory histidine kinase AtoS [Methanocella sp. PtaU1.Bin125]